MSEIDIIICNSSKESISEQIINQFKHMIISGQLKAEQPIPPMRSLAKSLSISVMTVQRAYDQLQQDGFIVSIVGKGSFVADLNHEYIIEELLKEIEEYLEKAVKLAIKSGIPYEKILEVMKIIYMSEERT